MPLILTIILVSSLHAQDEVLDKFTSGTVFNLKKDGKGRIWMATDKGLYVSDGVNYIQIKTGDREITNSSIVELVLYKNNLFLIYKDRGVIKLDINTLQYKNITNKTVASLISESDEKMYILFATGALYRVTLNQQQYKFDLVNQFGVDYNKPASMTDLSKNTLIVSLVNKGIYKINKYDGRIEKIYYLKPQGDNHFTHLGGRLFFINNNTLYELNDKDEFSKSNYIKENKNITSVIPISSTRKIIIKHQKNIYLESNEKSINLNLSKRKNYIINDAIYNSEDNILFATNQGIIEVLDIEQKIKPLFDSVIQLNDYINVRRKILPYKNNQIILMGSPLPHLYDFKKNKFTPLTKKFNYSSDAVLKGDIIYATSDEGGIKKIGIKKNTIKNIETNNIDTIRLYSSVCDIEKIIPNNIIFGSKGVVTLYNYINNTSKEISLNNINAKINSIKVDSISQLIYLATNDGIYVLDVLNNKLTKKTKIPNNIILDLVIMHTKNTTLLWYLSNEGLIGINLITNKIEIQLDLLNFNNKKPIALLADNRGRIWVSTYGGLYAYEYPINNIIKLETRNGLINNEFNFKSAALMQDGKLVFGGLNGYDIVQSSSLNFNGNPIKGNIMGYSIYDSKNLIYHHFNPNELIQYNTENNYIQLYFSLNDFEKLKFSEFEYQIDNGKWMSLYGLSFIYVYRLKDGIHTINIRGFDDSGNPIVFDQIKINYFTNFFQSTNFIYFLFLIVIILLSLIIAINYTNYTKINTIKNDIAMDLHDEIGTILNRTLFTLKNDSKNEQKNIAIAYLTEAMYSVRTYIKAFNIDKISTHLMIDEFKELVINYSKNDKIKYNFSYNFDKEYFLNSNEYRDFKLITYEINQNIQKHSKANIINTKVIIINNILTTVIEDDGCLENIIILENKGNGVQNIKKRAKRLNAEIQFTVNSLGKGLVIEFKFKLN